MGKINPQLLNLLKRFAEGIVAVVGPHCEVVVHDFADLEHSVVVVAGNVTGRQPGAPVPDLSFTSDELTRYAPDQINYRTRLGNRSIQSSTVWIRDENGDPIGAICINVDYTDLEQAQQILDRLTTAVRSTSPVTVDETFARDLDDLLDIAVTEFLQQHSVQSVDALSYEDRVNLIHELEARGLFRIRGAVNRLADLLNVSRASIYNYRASRPTTNNEGA